LPGKNKALRSNPSTTSQKKEGIQKAMNNLSKTESIMTLYFGKFNHALQNNFYQFPIISSRR
jgi:hypothetical protein